MKSLRSRWMPAIMAGIALFNGWAAGEVQVTLTISGDLDEILAVVQHLKQMGLGTGDWEPNDPLKLRIHSVQAMPGAEPAPEAAAPAETAPEPMPAPEPALALREASAVPPNPSPGAPVLVSVRVVDEEGRIDTLAATLAKTNVTVDLKDDGSHGDAAAGDGVWSATLPTPADAAGPYEIQIIAYDANGHPLMALNQDRILANISAQTGIEVPR